LEAHAPALVRARDAGATVHLDTEHFAAKELTYDLLRAIGDEFPDGPHLLANFLRQAGEGIWMNFLRPGHVAAEEKAAVEKARALLDFVTLSRLEGEPARVLSGGQRKLLELARILMAEPQAILLDEPAAGVNPTLLELIIDRVLALNAQGKSILLIEHNMEMVARLCGRVVVMAAGRYLTEGTPAEVAENRAVVDAYLGGVA